jgi:carbamate kinase
VIACGGGGIPVSRIPARPQTLQGVEAVIDKDVCDAKLALASNAGGYIILTDGGGIWRNFVKLDAQGNEGRYAGLLVGDQDGQELSWQHGTQD